PRRRRPRRARRHRGASGPTAAALPGLGLALAAPRRLAAAVRGAPHAAAAGHARAPAARHRLSRPAARPRRSRRARAPPAAAPAPILPPHVVERFDRPFEVYLR